jgi:hypothetical protein
MITERTMKRDSHAAGVLVNSTAAPLYFEHKLGHSHRPAFHQYALRCGWKAQAGKRHIHSLPSHLAINVGESNFRGAAAYSQLFNVFDRLFVALAGRCNRPIALLAGLLAKHLVSVHATDVSAFCRNRNWIFQTRALTGQRLPVPIFGAKNDV